MGPQFLPASVHFIRVLYVRFVNLSAPFFPEIHHTPTVIRVIFLAPGSFDIFVCGLIRPNKINMKDEKVADGENEEHAKEENDENDRVMLN